MTKPVHDELKYHLEDAKVMPTIIDNSLVIAGPSIVRKPKSTKVKVRMVKQSDN